MIEIRFKIPNGSMVIHLEQVLFRGTFRQFRKLLRLLSQDTETWEENRKLILENLKSVETGARVVEEIKWETRFHKMLGIMEEFGYVKF